MEPFLRLPKFFAEFLIRFFQAGRHKISKDLNSPCWIGGMFMGFRTSVFQEIGGFDQRYFMYLEDVDICATLWAAGYEVAIDTENSVIHYAQRGSRRDPKLFLFHLTSYIKYFKKWA